MKTLVSCMCLLLAAVTAFSQIEPVEKFVEDHENLQKFFVYQSTLRVLNQDQNPDFDRLIKDIKKINAYVAEGDADISDKSFDKMITALNKDKFEVLVDARRDGMMVKAYGKGDGKDAYYVITGKQGDAFALMEIDGALDLKYINSLMDVDITKLSDILLDQKEN